MAIELNKRTKIIAGVGVLLVGAAAVWFLFLDDFLNPPPPKPAASAPAKPAADAGKAVDAAKGPAAAAPAGGAKGGDAAKAAKPAAQAGAKPIPTNPDQLVAEVVEASGIRQSFLVIAREIAVSAVSGDGAIPDGDATVVAAAAGRQFDAALATEIGAGLKNNLDAERMARFLELLRDPAVTKLVTREAEGSGPQGLRDAIDGARKTPPSAARVKLVQSLDDISRRSEVGADLANGLARTMVDTMLESMQKAAKAVPAESRQAVGARLNAIRSQSRALIRSVMIGTLRDATDEELAAYLKVIDTDTGRWGMDRLAEAIRPAVAARAGMVGKDIAPIALSRRTSTQVKAPAAEPEPLPKAQPAPVAAGPKAGPAAPAEAPGYRRPANIKDLYSRYNDVITATVMRDRAAVKELLDDGKSPNARQSDGTTPLMVAVSNGDAEIASLLLGKGADVNARALGGLTALSIARARGAAGAAMAQLLQNAGAKE